MANPLYARMRICVVVFALAGPLPAGATEQPATIASATDKGVPMNHRASGPFDVKIIPQKADNPQAEAAGIGAWRSTNASTARSRRPARAR